MISNYAFLFLVIKNQESQLKTTFWGCQIEKGFLIGNP